MSWFVLCFFGILSNCVENILDKKALIITNLNDYLTSAIRLWFYVFFAFVLFYIIYGNFIIPSFNLVYLFLGLLSSFNSIAYSNILNKNQTTLLALLPIIVPVFFLLFEILSGINFNLISLISILITIFGGYIFLDFKNIYFDKKTIFMFCIMFLYIVIEYFYVKDFYTRNNIKPLEFFFNLVLISAITSTIIFFITLKNNKNVFLIKDIKKYLIYGGIAKFFDALSTYFYFEALLIISFSYYTAFNLLYLPILLLSLYFTQKILKIDIEEKFDKRSSLKKIFGSFLIISGQIFLIFNH